MNQELFDQLEQKVGAAVEAMELMKMETEELREENSRLKEEQQAWERRLTALLGELETVVSPTVSSTSSDATSA